MKLMTITTYATPRNVRGELLRAMRAAGHEVIVVAPEPAAVMREPLGEVGVGYEEWPVERTGIDPRADLKSASHLLAILRRHRPDAILVYQIKAVLLAPIVARLARVPRVTVLVNGLGAVFDERGFGATTKAKVARLAYAISLRAATRVVFQNHDDPEHLRARHLLSPRAAVEIVPGSGVDLEKLRALPIPDGPVTFTLVSRLLVSKGIRDLAAAARAIRAKHPTARFQLAGQLESPDHPDAITQAEIDGWVADGTFTYLGFSNAIGGVLAATTVFVLPSYYREGIPRTNLEAMAIGRPVVTTDSVGCRETVEDGVNGYLVPPRDPVALAAALVRYIEEPGLAERHGKASRAFVERTFDVNVVNAAMLRAITGA